MKRKLLALLLTAAMVTSSAVPASAAEFSSGLEETDGDNVDVVDADSDSEADISLAADAPSVDHTAGTENSFFSDSSADTSQEDTVENTFSSDEVPDISDGSEGSVGVSAAGDTLEDNILYCPLEKERIRKAAKEILSETGISNANTDLEIVCMLISWLRKHTSYADGNGSGPLNDMYGALVARKSKCDGFNEGFVYLATLCGLTARQCSGSSEIDSHAWSEVNLNGTWYVVDATATCYQAGSFLESYDHFWFHPFKKYWYSSNNSSFSTKTIDSSAPVYYLGANGNTLYARVGSSYYKNSGSGWVSVSSSDLPSVLYGDGDTERGNNTEVEHISLEQHDYSDSDYTVTEGDTFTRLFWISNPGACNKTAMDPIVCTSSDNSVATAEIIDRDYPNGKINVRVKGIHNGSCKITVSTPNGVSCSVNVKVNGRKCPDIRIINTEIGNANIKFDYNSLKQYKTGGKEGYQVFVKDEKSEDFRLDYENELWTVDSDSDFDFFVYAGYGKTVKIKCRLYTINKETNERVYGEFSNVLTATTPPSWFKIKSVSVKGTKAYLKWTKSKGADGYVIYRKTGKSGKYKKIKTITSGKKVNYTNTRLKKKQKYYYKVRAYHLDPNGKRVYTAWSNVKGVTCK